ncbi:zinc-binding dehydrogenase [Arthrobacter sp. GMC3]|uniref:zinc-dependent alcohol dehydrogenase n=1 Tax=Arthrobacter sp. GMC3 TaxID=2058894 RepID=UPI000CE39FF9|nr:alcohol dehydrogenase catalytic domain-containing protein [Arthrobacter sp. GMC3]
MSRTMRATAIVGERTSTVIEVPFPEPGAAQVLVRVTAAGVCASEKPLWENHDGGSPLRLGHEFAGVVESAGADAWGWRPGDRVTGLADLTFAEYVLVNTKDLFALPDHAPDVAGLGEPLACVMEAVARCGIGPGQKVAVVGVGFMGQIALQAVRAAGADHVVAVDVREALFANALALGANRVALTEQIVDAERASFDAVIELSGTAAGLHAAGALVGTHGTLCIAGYHHDGPRQLDVEWWYRGITVINGFSPIRERQRAALRAGLELIDARQLTLEPLVTHTFGLDGLDAAYAPRQPGSLAKIKAVLIP